MLDATWFEAEEPGIYLASAGERRMRVAVNVANVTAVNASRLAGYPTANASPASHSAVDPWMAVLVAAALLLVLEWWTYNRRMTV
jgi:hypothetical protein